MDLRRILMGLLRGRCILVWDETWEQTKSKIWNEVGRHRPPCLRTDFLCLFVVAGHGANDIGVTPVGISRITSLKALFTAMLVNPDADCRMGIGGKGTM
jgi:hypothetical protein